MKKRLVYLLISIFIFSACEKDDFCIENTVTSKLIIDFYDDTNRETLKNVGSFYVWAEGKKDTLFENITKNSISIPLNSLAKETIYNFSKANVVEKFTIKYDTEEAYISRSCGYKVVFNNVEFSSDTNSWITDFTPTTIINLDDQSTAHVQIFH